MEPLDFLDKIAALIPPPRRHRHHYHGVFAPNSPLRKLIAASANRTPKNQTPPVVKEAAEKAAKVSLNWAKLIARIYEINPLLCTCGKEMKIVAIVTHPTKIYQILSCFGWPTDKIDFDPPYELQEWNISQLVTGTHDGFPSIEEPCQFETSSDSPHWESGVDPPHWEDPDYITYD